MFSRVQKPNRFDYSNRTLNHSYFRENLCVCKDKCTDTCGNIAARRDLLYQLQKNGIGPRPFRAVNISYCTNIVALWKFIRVIDRYRHYYEFRLSTFKKLDLSNNLSILYEGILEDFYSGENKLILSEGVKIMVKIIKLFPSLDQLDLSCNNLAKFASLERSRKERAIKIIAETLENKTFFKINLSGNSFGWKDLAIFDSHRIFVEELDLSCNFLCKKGDENGNKRAMLAVINIILDNHLLRGKKLLLSNVRLDLRSFSYFLDQLYRNIEKQEEGRRTKIKFWDLSRNPLLGDEGLIIFTRFLINLKSLYPKVFDGLSFLDFRGNNISEKCAEYFIEFTRYENVFIREFLI